MVILDNTTDIVIIMMVVIRVCHQPIQQIELELAKVVDLVCFCGVVDLHCVAAPVKCRPRQHPPRVRYERVVYDEQVLKAGGSLGNAVKYQTLVGG